MDARDQEKAFEKLLARTLRKSLQPGGLDCPGPDLLAAYADHSLSDAEASQWERHFAGCARCQQALAAVDASAVLLPADERRPAALPVTDTQVAAAAAVLPATAKPAVPGILRGPQEDIAKPPRYLSWRWLVSAAGVAAVVALWITLRPAPQLAPAPVASQPAAEPPAEIAQNNSPPAPRTEAQSYEGAEKKTEPSPQARAAESRAEKVPGEPAKSKQAAGARQTPGSLGRLEQDTKTVPGGAGARETAPLAEARGAISTPKDRADQPLAAEKEKQTDKIPAAQGKPAEAALSAGTPRKTEADKMAKAQPGLGGSAPPPAPATPKQADEEQPGKATRQLYMTRSYLAAKLVAIPSPDPSVLWRAGPGGSIERSRDAGRTWETQVSNVTADLLAGSAPSETVCWVVGRAGTILRTTDGEQWEKVFSPVPADWIGIQARDALHASVATAGRERYTTNDGGKTWRGPLGK